MKDHLIVGIDLGSSAIRLAVGQITIGADKRETLSIWCNRSSVSGISKGSINSLECQKRISASLEQVERQVACLFPKCTYDRDAHDGAARENVIGPRPMEKFVKNYPTRSRIGALL
jgi:hypothetical protein